MLRKTLLGLGMGFAMVLAGTSTATAGDCHKTTYYYKTVTCYEKVVCWEVKKEPYTKCVTIYDQCGKPVTVKVTCWREVKVPVEKIVPVTKKVLVCN